MSPQQMTIGMIGIPGSIYHGVARAGHVGSFLRPRYLLDARDQAAKGQITLEQLCLSPQCGFSSTVHGNVIPFDAQWAKIRLVQETAREVWG